MLRNILSNFFKIIISFNLIVTPAFSSSGPTSEERTLDKIDTFLKTGTPSDIPFIEYMESFIDTSTQPLKRFDLSEFEGKKIFLGYGVYDTEQKFCKYVEKPGMPEPDDYLEKISTFNKHSYAISLQVMNYEACKALASEFNGKPIMIQSEAENGFISSKFGNKSKWIGMERNNCSEPYYSEDGAKQEYFNWSSVSEQAGACDESDRNAIHNAYGTWNKEGKQNLNHCVIEVDSPEIERPIKICAPWWRIEREFQNEEETTFYGVDVYKINQADIPEQFNVCTKFDEDALAESASANDRQVTCTSYYDSTMAPECVRNPYQDICHVDECNGYIKNACRLIDTYTGFKDYTKAEMIVNNSRTIEKGKSKIKTHIYDCPASLPSIDSCEEQSQVIIFPQECPNSDCEGYKNCVQESSTIAEKNTCSSKHVCEKIYGNPDNVEYNPDGTINVLKNTCSDGTVLEFTPSIQNSTSRKCLEYEQYTIEEEVSQKCVLERAYNDYSVDTSLTEEDIYMNNPNCIRMNNILDARATIQVTFKYENYGMAQTIIKKTYLDGTENVSVQDGSDADIVGAAMNPVDPLEDAQEKAEANAIYDVSALSDCSSFNQAWTERTGNILNETFGESRIVDGNSVNYSYASDYLGMDNNGDYYAKFLDVIDESMCSTISSQISGINTDYQTISKVCKVYLNKMSADQFSLVEGIGSPLTYTDSDTNEVYREYSDYTYITKDLINEDDCKEIAYCLDGSYNESAFSSSSTSQCQVSAGDNYEFQEEVNLPAISQVVPDEHDEDCKPVPMDGSYMSQLDGTQDIFSIQEIVTGDWGYYSNYNSHPIQNNVVSVNDKEVYPIMPIPIIEDALVYEGDIDQTSIRSSKPNIVAGSIGGTVAGLMATGPIGWVIAVVIIVFVIVSILFGKKKKYNEQKWIWTIYKLVSTSRYVDNIYGYDHRILELNDDGSTFVNGSNQVKLIYAESYGHTGTLKPGDFKNMLNNLYVQKVSLLTCMGWMKTDIENITHSSEKGVIVSYPKCKKWSWSCNKKRTEHFDHDRDPFFKNMANNYIGATNGVSIVVPYLGDYVLEAYDVNDNLLGTINIRENDFRETTSDVSMYAQVMFGLNMDLASGINEGLQNNACRYDLMTEFGGGVSGIYYENNDTGQNKDCQKSHDAYVKSHAATKIKIKSLTADRYHVVDLVKPLPFANRVFLVTLNEKEIREYRCYEEFGECLSDDYSTVTEE